MTTSKINPQLIKQLEAELARLVAMPTYSSGTSTAGSIIAIGERSGNKTSANAIEDIAHELRELGMHVHLLVDEGYHSVVATTQRTKRPKVLLHCHLDVIRVKNKDLLTVRHDGDKLVGRGVFDMKFALACYMQFFRTHKHQLKDLDVGVMLTTDEEVGGFHGTKLLAEQGWGGDIILNPDGGDDWAIEYMAKGMWTVTLTANGTRAHSSRPWEGDSAFKYLIPAVQEIIKLFPNEDKMALTCNVSEITGGEAFNQVAAVGSAILDIRSYNAEEAKHNLEKISQIAVKHSLTYQSKLLGLPVNTDINSPQVKAFAKHVESITNKPCEFIHSYGATDSRWFTDDSMQNVIIRPTGGGTHGDYEWMLREDLPKFYQLIESSVLDMAKI